MLPKLFIASSSNEDSKLIAEELKKQLNKFADIFCWFDQTVFRNGRHTLTDLLRISRECDMGVFIFNVDDSITFKGHEFLCTRDNVLFEYGLFVSSVGTENSFLLCPEKNPNFHLPEDLKGLTYITFNPDRKLPGSVVEGIAQIKERIHEWEIEKKSGRFENYFKKFYKEEEPPLKDGQTIDFNRSFNLLLYMFGQESFKEFRALDLAFNRWEEASKEALHDKNQGQITNYSNEILKSVRQLFITGRCTNFRRILVISKLSFSTVEDHNVLRIIHDEEKKAIAKRKEICARNKSGYSTQEILETRILFVEPGEYVFEFKHDNDYALFTGEQEEFAIVETTLTSTKPYEGNPNCIIVTEPEKLRKRKMHFDNFWENETVSIEDFLKENFQKDKSNTIFRAFNVFTNYYANSRRITDACVFVEMAYVDLINVEDKRRRMHFERACELLNSLSSITAIKGNIYLGSFINDFRPKKIANIDCDAFCEINKSGEPDDFKSLKNEVSEELKSKNSSFHVNVDCIATFYMTNTRTAAVKSIKTIRAHPEKRSYLELVERKGRLDVYDVSLKIKGNKPVDLGYEKDKLMVPNCALLMAEHYFELFKFMYAKSPAMKDFWIFDFLLVDEELAVKQGIDAACELFNWPGGVTLNVVNCSYFSKGEGSYRHNGPYKF